MNGQDPEWLPEALHREALWGIRDPAGCVDPAIEKELVISRWPSGYPYGVPSDSGTSA